VVKATRVGLETPFKGPQSLTEPQAPCWTTCRTLLDPLGVSSGLSTVFHSELPPQTPLRTILAPTNSEPRTRGDGRVTASLRAVFHKGKVVVRGREGMLSQELARALQVDGVGADPGLLPDLREIVIPFFAALFGQFVRARQVAGRPVCLR
jgi:hypothetical protein